MDGDGERRDTHGHKRRPLIDLDEQARTGEAEPTGLEEREREPMTSWSEAVAEDGHTKEEDGEEGHRSQVSGLSTSRWRQSWEDDDCY